MSHRRSLTTLAFAVALAVAVLSGCSGVSGDTSAEASSDPEPVTLTFQSLSDQPAAIEATATIVDAWNSANPGIHVTIVPAGWDGIFDKLITQFNGGDAPDIVHYEAAGINSFAADGYLADLTGLMDPSFKEDVPAGVLDTVTVDGKIIAYPTELQSYVVFANKGLLDAAGVKIPQGDTMTWDELQEIAAATTKDGAWGLGWGLKSPTAAFMALAPGFGGQFFSGTGRDAKITIGAGELAVPNIVADMTAAGTISPVTLTQSGSEVLASFYAGQVAMTIQGSYQAANIATDAPAGLDWVVLPPLEGTTSADQAANPQTLSVNVDSPHIAEAAKFLNFLTETSNLAALAQADALIPASTSAQDRLSEELGGDGGWNVILASGQHFAAAPYLFVDTYAQWKDAAATPAFQRFLSGETTSDSLAAELKTGWDHVTP